MENKDTEKQQDPVLEQINGLVEKLKNAQSETGLSPADVAVRAGIRAETVNGVETRTTDTRLLSFARVADALGFRLTLVDKTL